MKLRKTLEIQVHFLSLRTRTYMIDVRKAILHHHISTSAAGRFGRERDDAHERFQRVFLPQCNGKGDPVLSKKRPKKGKQSLNMTNTNVTETSRPTFSIKLHATMTTHVQNVSSLCFILQFSQLHLTSFCSIHENLSHRREHSRHSHCAGLGASPYEPSSSLYTKILKN